MAAQDQDSAYIPMPNMGIAPSWYRNTLSCEPDVLVLRHASLNEKMAFANHCKAEGKSQLDRDDITRAVRSLERALSVFSWLEFKDPRGSCHALVRMLLL